MGLDLAGQNAFHTPGYVETCRCCRVRAEQPARSTVTHDCLVGFVQACRSYRTMYRCLKGSRRRYVRLGNSVSFEHHAGGVYDLLLPLLTRSENVSFRGEVHRGSEPVKRQTKLSPTIILVGGVLYLTFKPFSR